MIHATLMLRRRDRDQQVLDYLHRAGEPVTVADVSQACGISPRHAPTVLPLLRPAGELAPAPGRMGTGRRGRLPTRYRLADDRQSRYAQEHAR